MRCVKARKCSLLTPSPCALFSLLVFNAAPQLTEHLEKASVETDKSMFQEKPGNNAGDNIQWTGISN